MHFTQSIGQTSLPRRRPLASATMTHDATMMTASAPVTHDATMMTASDAVQQAAAICMLRMLGRSGCVSVTTQPRPGAVLDWTLLSTTYKYIAIPTPQPAQLSLSQYPLNNNPIAVITVCST